MKNNNEVYLVKYRVENEPHYQIVHSNFRFEESAMKKVEEIRKSMPISEIIVNKRNGYKSTKVYSWCDGFEAVYLNRRMA